jgi:hypothetical protein
MLTFVTLALLLPFLGKPISMDDPLFIRAAQHILAHPLDPYGFEINWYGSPQPMWQVTMNPPSTSYYMAALAGIFGWSETVLHAVFLPAAIALVVGTWHLARQFCRHPMTAAILVPAMPVVLISSSTLMCDVPMLAAWVWAVIFWERGEARSSRLHLVGAAILISLAAMAKYYGACLIPLLAAYSLIRNKFAWRHLAWLVIPVVVLGGYDLAGRHLYGRSLLLQAGSYAGAPSAAKLETTLIALAFTGGCTAPVTLLAPLLWRKPILGVMLGGAAVAVLLFASVGLFLKGYGPIQGTSLGWIEMQTVFWVFGGVSTVSLAISDIQAERTVQSWLLGLWVLGTFLFTALINWTVNGRSILPMAPAVAILIVRRFERNGVFADGFAKWKLTTPVTLSFALTLLATHADVQFARAARQSAEQTFAKYGHGRFFFQGHWGFQYYMENLGASSLDENNSRLNFGDVVAQPVNNTNYRPLNPELAVLGELMTVSGPGWIATVKGEVGAGFYASSRGPLPFAFGNIPPEQIAVCVLEPPLRK